MSKWIKRLGIALGGLLGLMVIAALVLPLVIDVDSYRPKIVSLAESYLNGKLELGKLRLSLWGQVRVQVEGVTISDAEGRKVVSANDVYFHLPLWSLLTASPELTLRMKKPTLSVTKDKKGNLDILELPKKSPALAPPTPSAAPTPQPAANVKTSLPSLAVKARLGVEISDAHLDYRDEGTALTTQINDLNLRIQDLSLSHPVKIELWANLDTKMGTTITVKGPARLDLEAQPEFVDGNFKHASVQLKADLNAIEIAVGELFQKSKTVPAHAEGNLEVTADQFKIASLLLTFFNAKLSVEGAVNQLTSEPLLAINFHSDPISLQPWSGLVPMLEAYELGGTAVLKGNLSGLAKDPKYHAELSASDVTAKSPVLKAQPNLNAKLVISTDRIDSLQLSLRAPANDLKVSGSLLSFSKPKLAVSATSTGMDLDQLIEFPKKTKAGVGPSGKNNESAAKPADSKNADYDALLDPLRENALAVNTIANIKWDLASVKAYGVKMSAVSGALSLRNLALTVDRFHLGLWGGNVVGSAGVQLKPKIPQYRFHTEVSTLDLRQAVASQLELFKNTLLGSAFFKADLAGASFNPDPAKLNLDAKGNMHVDHASFASIDIGKMGAEAATKSISGVAGSIPGLKNQNFKPPSIASKYQTIGSDFTVAKGVFNAPNFVGKAEANQGLDIKGSTSVGLKDYSLKADWEISDTYNLTKLKDIAVDQGGLRVEHIFADGNNPVRFPIHVGGTVFSPDISYTSVAEALSKVALNNVGKALQSKANAELQKAAQQQLNNVNAPPAIKKTLEGLGKKLFGN